MQRRMTLAALLLWVFVTTSAMAVEPENGTFELRFEKSTPLRSVQSLRERLGEPEDTELPPDYDIAQQIFRVHVPEEFAPDKGFGLLVWIGGSMAWSELCKPMGEARLVLVQPQEPMPDGIAPPTHLSIGRALDAVYNLVPRYDLNKQRIYIGGESPADRTGIAFGDIFCGMLLVQVDGFFESVPTKPRLIDGLGDRSPEWEPAYAKPNGPGLELAKKRSRVVIVPRTLYGYEFGDRDYDIVERGFKPHFKHVTVLKTVHGRGAMLEALQALDGKPPRPESILRREDRTLRRDPRPTE